MRQFFTKLGRVPYGTCPKKGVWTMSTLSIGSMNQLGDALEKEGYDANLITKLRSNTHLIKQIKSILKGDATVVKLSYIIDTNAEPHIPEGWKIEEHKSLGKIEWDLSKAKLFLPKRQRNGGVKAIELRRELSRLPLLNATVLDYLLMHHEIIPQDWKKGNICFWGTIYRDTRNQLRVRHLFHGDRDGEWKQCYGTLDIFHNERYPVTIFSSH